MNAIAILLPTKSHDEAYRELFDRGETKVGYSLFAATKDFKVGDEVADQFGKKFTFTKEKEIELAHAVNDLPKELSDRTWHKILGELSPNATWVKDGDKIVITKRFPVFEHDEGGEWELITGWHPGDYEKSTPPNKMTVEKKAKDRFGPRTGIKKSVPVTIKWVTKVLGPCGHFH